MKRRTFLYAACGGACLAAGHVSGCAAGADRPARRRPNIVLIAADDLGYGHLGCYGQEKIRTPHIDRMARGGMRFTDFYAGFTVCAPSRSVLMTGLHHGHTPVRSNSGSSSLRADETTVAEVLHRAGYTTGGFGKWGLGIQGTPGHPNRKGFDTFYGFYHQVHAHFYYPYWIWHNDKKMPLPGNEDGKREQYVEDVLHGKAMAFIRSSATRSQPFFCYIPSIVPHVELAVPEESVRPYRGKVPAKTINDPRKGYIGSDDAYAVYAGMISRLDRHVGEVLSLIDELGIAEETLVLFTSDNGPQGGPWKPLADFFNGAGPLSGTKGTLLEGGIRVPLVARWPGHIEPGTVSDHVGGFQDMMPTFAELAGAEPPKTDGLSIVPTLLGRPGQKEHAYLYWGSPKRTQAVRMGRFKGFQVGKEPWRLYDLERDPAEQTDVASAHPAVVAEIGAAADEAYSPPREQVGGTRVGIRDFVSGPRITEENAR